VLVSFVLFFTKEKDRRGIVPAFCFYKVFVSFDSFLYERKE